MCHTGESQKFNSSNTSLKDTKGIVKQFQEWCLAQLIDPLCDSQLLKLGKKLIMNPTSTEITFMRTYK